MKSGSLIYGCDLQIKEREGEVVVDRDEHDCNESSTKSRGFCGETRVSSSAQLEGLYYDARGGKKRASLLLLIRSMLKGQCVALSDP